MSVNKKIFDNVLISEIKNEYNIKVSTYIIDNYKKRRQEELDRLATENKITKSKIISRTFINRGLINDFLYFVDGVKFNEFADTTLSVVLLNDVKEEVNNEFKEEEVKEVVDVSQSHLNGLTEVQALKEQMKQMKKQYEMQLQRQENIIQSLEKDKKQLIKECDELRNEKEFKRSELGKITINLTMDEIKNAIHFYRENKTKVDKMVDIKNREKVLVERENWCLHLISTRFVSEVRRDYTKVRDEIDKYVNEFKREVKCALSTFEDMKEFLIDNRQKLIELDTTVCDKVTNELNDAQKQFEVPFKLFFEKILRIEPIKKMKIINGEFLKSDYEQLMNLRYKDCGMKWKTEGAKSIYEEDLEKMMWEDD